MALKYGFEFAASIRDTETIYMYMYEEPSVLLVGKFPT